MLTNPKKIIIGLSGGVDSSVAAFLLLEQGYEVEGLFMKNWEEDDTEAYCSAEQDLEDVDLVCQRLGIKYSTINFASEYWDQVFEYFLAEYKAGRTPNPDILCNREIKFKAFLDHALSQGAERIATGHYVRTATQNGFSQLLKGLDDNKDQSYFLALLNQYQLSHSLFPLGSITKPEVRIIATQLKLPNFEKKDSTGICFIGERPFKKFLQQYIPVQAGEMINEKGKVIGKHEGLMFYTIGQRQGLGIGGSKDNNNDPWYVAGKNLDSNQLIVVQGSNHPLLFKQSLSANAVHWISEQQPCEDFSCYAKTRYRQTDQKCKIKITANDKIEVEFDQAQRAITPGQYIVMYDHEKCLGGGVIC